MESLRRQRILTKTTDLVTILLSRPIFFTLNTFDKRNILDIKEKHAEMGFVKSFLESEYDKNIYMVYDSKGYYVETVKNHHFKWEVFYNSVINSSSFIEEVKLSDNIYAFKIKFPEKFIDDFNKIINGEYSKISKEYITKFYPDEDSVMYNLKNRTPELIDAYSEKFKINTKIFDTCEVGPKMILEKEIFQFNVDKMLI